MQIAEIKIDYEGTTWFVRLATSPDARHLDLSPLRGIRAELGPDDDVCDRSTTTWMRTMLYDLCDEFVRHLEHELVDRRAVKVVGLFNPLPEGPVAG